MAGKLRCTRRADGWWVVGHDPEMGPYDTRREADDDRAGVERFYRARAAEEKRREKRRA